MKKSYFIIFICFCLTHVSSQNYMWDWAIESKGLLNPRIQTLNGYVYLTATFNGTAQIGTETLHSPSGPAGIVAKVDASGNVVWHEEVYASEIAIADIQTYGNHIYIGGTFGGTLTGYQVSEVSAGGTDIFVLKVSTTGNVSLLLSDGSALNETMVGFDTDPQVVVMGQFFPGASISGQPLTGASPSALNTFISEYDISSGNNIWVQEISGDPSSSAKGIAIQFDMNGDVIVQGENSGPLNYAGTNTGFCMLCHPLIRLNGSDGSFSGFIADLQDGNGGPHEVSSDWGIDASNNIYNNATFWCNICDDESTIVKYDPTGTELFHKNLFPPPSGITNSLKMYVENKDIYTSGHAFGKIALNGSMDTVTGSHIYVLHLDTLANSKGGAFASASASDAARVNDISADGTHHIYLAGLTSGQVSFGTHLMNTAGDDDVVYLAKLGVSTITGTRQEQAAILSVFPNPSKGNFLVQLNQQADRAKITVYNALGSVVYSETKEHMTRIPLDLNQPKGVYFIEVQTGDSKLHKSIVIE